MRTQLLEPLNFGIGASAVAVVGTWDPVVPAHCELFRSLVRYGKRHSLVPLVVILYPSPAKLLNRGPGECPEFCDIRARGTLIKMFAPVEVIVVRFTRPDLEESCHTLFRLLSKHVLLRELWLGPNQSLGSGGRGSDAAITAWACRNQVHLRRLKPNAESNKGGLAVRFLQQGKIKRAITWASHPPIWRRPRSGKLLLDWPSGEYVGVPLSAPSDFNLPRTRRIRLKLASTGVGQIGSLSWPANDVPWLAFLAGPADRAIKRR
jgi:hypothetical protein